MKLGPAMTAISGARRRPTCLWRKFAAVQRIVRSLMAAHHNPQKPLKSINGADPFVIAMAKDGGPRWTVVSDEHPGTLENRKIPFVCKAEGVLCITFQQLMLGEGWQFR